MEELGSVWIHDESIDALKQRLLHATVELEALKFEANEETRKHNEDLKQLLNLLKIAYQERDEAKNQLRKLLNKMTFCCSTELHPLVPQAQPESPLVIPTKANSSITESNSLSDTYNPQSYGSSPVDSFFDAVTSPDFSNINMADSCHVGLVNKSMLQEYSGSMPTSLARAANQKADPADAIVDNLVKGRALPQKGKLLQTVMEAGPLLQTLLVAGPLPRWRNPPPLQPFKIPPVSIKGPDATNIIDPTLAANAEKLLRSPSYLEMSRGSSQMCSASVLNFGTGASLSNPGNRCLLNPGPINQIPSGKRQRL